MNFKYLKTFITVAECGSFSNAAQQLHTVQSAISRHISNLEQSLGFTLFERSTRYVELTAAGKYYYSQVAIIHQQLALAQTNSQMIADGKMGVLRIGYLSSVCAMFLPDLLRNFTRSYPNIMIEISDMTAEEQFNALTQGTIDISFTRTPNHRQLHTVNRQFLFNDHIVAVTAHDHVLAGQYMLTEQKALTEQPVLTLEKLGQYPLTLFNRQQAPDLFDSIISEFHQQGIHPEIISEPKHMQSLLTQVASSQSVALVPSGIDHLQTNGCQFMPINVKINIALEMHWHKQANSMTEIWVDWFSENHASLLS